jgi:N-acylneuraminate cytidylyltransferase
MGLSVLAVIPARGGSRGIPDKNLTLVGGEPLVIRAIKAALAAEMVDRVVVSTDSDAIASVSATAGAEIVRRPPELAGDGASTESALLHVLDALGPPEAELVVTLEPTSPLRRSQTIDACVRRALETGADSLLTVCETREVLGKVADGIFVRLDPEQPRRRQLRQPLYSEAGAVYVTRTEYLRAFGSILGAEPLAVVVSAEEALDVNAPIDLRVAQAIADSS